jgi:hypothetical protein
METRPLKEARQFWEQRIGRAIEMMTDHELAAMASDFLRHPGAVFNLELVHKADSSEALSRAYVLFVTEREGADLARDN